MEASVLIAVVYHSGFGHTRRQAQAVAAGAGRVAGTAVQLLDVETLDASGWEILDAAQAIIFGAPTYMGSPSARFKAFAEASSAAWADNLRWKDKIAAGFTNSQNISGDKLNTLLSFAVLAGQHGMHWVSLGLYPGWNTSRGSSEDLNRLGSFLGAMAQSNGDESAETAPPESDLQTAESLGRRVAEVTRDYVRGRTVPAGQKAAAYVA